MNNVSIIKKDNTLEKYDSNKIKVAVGKSASRVMITLSDIEKDGICKIVERNIQDNNLTEVPVETMHSFVELALDQYDSKIAKSYRDFRNYKVSFVRILDDVYQKSLKIRYLGDKENSNTDSALVATKRSLIYNQLNKELYQKFFMTTEEVKTCRDGFIYIHDMSARLDTLNCCIFSIGDVLRNGFEMGNIWYNEPKTLDTAFDVIGDVVLSAAAQQYGGFTLPEMDKVLSYYAEKSYNKYIKLMTEDLLGDLELVEIYELTDAQKERIDYRAEKRIKRDLEQGFQGLEYKLNTVGSSRGDYPFIALTTGLATDRWGKLVNKIMFEVHMEGQGKEGKKKPVLFPKYVFLYDEEIHGEEKECEDVFEIAVECSSKTMYPDYLSLSGEGYVPSMYKKYKKVVSPMGKASLQPIQNSSNPLLMGCVY